MPTLTSLKESTHAQLTLALKDEQKQREIRRLEMTTHFSAEQLGMLYKQFEKLSEIMDGEEGGERTISYMKFKKIMKKVMPHLFPKGEKEMGERLRGGGEKGGEGVSGGGEGKDEDVCRSLFELFDLSGSGELTFKELMAGLSLFYQGTVQEKILLAFRLYDLGMCV